MERAAVPLPISAAVVFRDGLGDRRHVVDPAGNETLELLCLRGELAAVPSFEFALRERVSRLATFRHASYGRVRSVERLADRDAVLTVVSDRTPGIRLSEMLVNAEQRRLGLDINTALCLIRQLVPAVAMLHESAREAAHGAIGPERLVITPNARLVIVEYVMGAALEQLRFSQERYWHELRVPLPRTPGLPPFDQRADITQVGVVALSLILGRSLRDDEYPSRIGDVVASTWAVSARGGFEPLPPGLRGWLGRALQLDPRNAFTSAVEARAELDSMLRDNESIASPASLESFLARYHAAEPAGAGAGARGGPVRATEPPKLTPARPAIVVAPARAQTASTDGVSAAAAAPSAVQGPSAALTTPPAPAVVQPTQAPPPALTTQATPAVDIQPLADSVATRTPPRGTPVPHTLPPPASVDVPGRLPPVEAKLPGAEPFWEEETSRSRWPRRGAVAALIAVLVGGGTFAGRKYLVAAPTAVTTGTLVITTNPEGAEASVDGQPRGATPLTLTLSPGSHTVVLRAGSSERSIPVTIVSGAQVAQYIELPQTVATLGQLQIRTEPPGAKVTVDGVRVGTSPMMVIDLERGEHTVLLESELGSVKQAVTIEPGMTASLVVPLGGGERAPGSGWIAVTAPAEVQLYEGARLLGTSRSDRIMVSAGRHEIDIVNEELGYRVTRVVQVPSGAVASFAVGMPKGTVALNALPWAEAWIDGERVGETPIGNLPIAVGRHDVVLRHPELGEQHHVLVVTLKNVARLSVDLRKK